MSRNIILLLCVFVLSIESRRSLRNYVVSQNSFNTFQPKDYLIYDSFDNSLICRLQSLNNGLNLTSNLLIYPSNQKIGSITNIWSPFLYQSNVNVLDDQLNRWIKGQIFERYRSQDFQFLIKYGGNSFIMENKYGSLITQIRDQRRPNYILSRFYLNPLFGLFRYNIEIYTDDLPDPIYILALSALDSTTNRRRRRIQFIP